MAYDAHTHLDFTALPAGAETRARAAGIDGWCIAGADPADWERVRQVAADTGAHVALGVHPWVADRYATRIEALLASLEAVQPLDGVGELGLDRGSPGFDDTQSAVARTQLAWAREHDLPVVLHCVGAHGPLLELLESEGVPRSGGLIHAFTGAAELARRYARLGLHVSFGHTVLRSPRTRAAFAALDPARRLLETDAPEGADEPLALIGLATCLARCTGGSAAAILARTGANARVLFPRTPEHP